jgi:hypothetical protein
MSTSNHTTSACLCPACGLPKHDFVFLPEGGARCVECNDSGMLAAVRQWRDGEIQTALAKSLEQYISDLFEFQHGLL